MPGKSAVVLVDLYSFIVVPRLSPFYICKLTSSFLTQLVSFFLVYILTPSEYGILALVLTLAQVMYILTSGWTDISLLNIGTRNYKNNNSYSDVVEYRAIIVIVSFLVVSFLYLTFKNEVLEFITDKSLYYYTFLLYVSLSLYSFSYQLLYPGGKNSFQSVSELILIIIYFISILFFIRSIKGYILLNFFIYALYFIIILIAFQYFFKFKIDHFSKGGLNEMVRFSFWQLLASVGIYLTNASVNYIFMLNSVNLDEIGLFNFAYKLLFCFSPIFAMGNIKVPQWIFNSEHDLVIKKTPKYICLGVVILSVMFLVLYFLFPLFLRIIGKDDYLKSIDYYILLFPAFLCLCINQFLNMLTLTTKYYKHGQYATFLQGFVLVLVGLFLVPGMGTNGAIIAITISFFFNSIYLIVIYNKKVKQQLCC